LYKKHLNETTLKTKNIIDSRLATNTSTSGRIEIWKTSLKIIKEKKIILGYGPQADRLLLSKHQGKTILNNRIPIYDNNSSNALIYSYFI
jgi:O-antigen ligase